MADEEVVVKKIAFYWGSVKAATVNKVSVEFNNGREALLGQDGIIAYSKGIAKMKLTIGEVVPVEGSSSTKDIDKILAQESITVSFILGGKFYRKKMAVLTATYESDTEKGVTTGNIVLESGKPNISG